MARDLVTAALCVRDGGVDAKAATIMVAINTTNNAEIAVTKSQRLILHVKNTVGSAKNVTIKAGVGARSGVGDLVVSLAATSGEQVLGPLESSRFGQSDQKFYIDFESGMTGLIGGYLLP